MTRWRSEGDSNPRCHETFDLARRCPKLALFLPQRYTRGSDLAIVVGFYALAKVLEALDIPIFAAGHIVSGHTLKHLAAAAAGYFILRMLQKRRPLVPLPSTAPTVAPANLS